MSRYDSTASRVKLEPRMQNDVAYASARTMSSSQPQPYGGAYDSVYSSSIFGPRPSRSSSVAAYGVQSNSDTSQAYRNKLYQSPLLQNRQEMVNRHRHCLKRLHEAAEEDDALRRENSQLGNVNVELNKQLSLLIHASIQKEISSSSVASQPRSPFGIVNGIRGLSIDGKEEKELTDHSQTSDVMDKENAENVNVERINGYVKLPPVTAATNAAARTRNAARSGTAKPVSASVQKVYVQGGKKEEVPLELEVLNQGMFRTELCNKWQESGDCPYKDHCRFALGVKELCPMICHPHYKTEVCRMVLAGDACPYGHRCQFRHALTEEEKQLAGGNNMPSSPTRLQICSYPGSCHGTTILWIRLATVVLVGVDSMATTKYLPHDPNNKRVFKALESVNDEKFIEVTPGVFATLGGDKARCLAMKEHVKKNIKESNVTLDYFDTICNHAIEYFSSHPRDPKLEHKTEVDLLGWIEDEKRHRIIRVGDDFQTVKVIKDACSGTGSGSVFVIKDLKEKATQYSTMEISEGVEWLKHLLIKASLIDLDTGGYFKVYCFEEGKEQLKYTGELMDELDNSKYAELFFTKQTMLVIIEKRDWNILTAEDLKKYLLERFNEKVTDIHWLGWPNNIFLLYQVVLSSQKARNEWFESCQRFKPPVRQQEITIPGVGSCTYFLGFATKSLLDRARKMTSFDDLASTVKRY